MKNFYQEGNNSDKTEKSTPKANTPQGQSGQGGIPVGAPVYYQTGQPVYPPPPPPNFAPQQNGAQPGAAPQGYYYAQVPQGAPMPYFQLTPEQIAILLQQYVVPMQYTQAPPPQTPPADNGAQGMRILYQSPDFDSPASAGPAENYEYDEEDYDDGEYEDDDDESDFQVREHVVVEEETFARTQIKKEEPEVKEETPFARKASFSVDDMEMSTFELDSIMLRRDTPREEKKLSEEKIEEEFFRPQKVGYASAGFSVEETYEETTEQITPEKPLKKPQKAKAAEKNKGKKKTSTSEIIRRVILAVAVIAIIISSGVLVKEFLLSRENANLEDEVSGLIIDEQTTTEPDPEKPTKEDEQTTTEKVLTPEEQWAEIKKEYPSLVFPDFMQLKYAKLYATNQDFVGYLEIDGLDMSLPIVQGNDDEEYLEKNFYGKKTKYGCPFVTHYNNMLSFDMNTIIFGHHMNNGSVFGVLDKYKSIEGFRANPVISFNTLYADYNWKVIAAFITNAVPEDDNGYVFKYYFTNLSTQERFSAYLSELSQRSLYDTGVDVLPTDKLLTLSTCTYEFDNARFVVVARLVRDGESTEVDTSKATVNGNPRYPQAYYDAKKIKTNPYANASRWEVD